MGQIIRLKPVFKQMVWGGNRMRDVFGYDIPGEDTGECWAVAAHEHGDCLIDGGEYDGQTLSRLWSGHPELFSRDAEKGGTLGGEVFPLLTKIIDARDDLSIQVHPDDEYAGINENGSKGKMECWYVLDCTPGATLVMGHNACTHKELEDMVREGRWKDLIREIPIRKGDFFQIFPGTLHAIKGGTMILETQQNSDVTYRVYDYGRLSHGVPRQLHLKQALDVIKVPFDAENRYDKGKPFGCEGEGFCIPLVSCERYKVWHAGCSGIAGFRTDEPFLICSVISGEGKVLGQPVAKGDHFILTGSKKILLEGTMEMICSAPT